MWTHEHSIEIAASPSRIWRLFADVPNWKRWNAGIERIELHGRFANGTTFTMQPPGQDAFQSTLVDVTENAGFTDETTVGDVRVVVRHTIVPLGGGRAKVIYRTEVSGPDADNVGAMVSGDFPDVLRALKDLAEQRADDR